MLVSVRTRWGCLAGAGRDEKNIQFQNWEHASSQQPMHLNIWSKEADMWSPKSAAEIRKKKRKTMTFGSVYLVFIGLAFFCLKKCHQQSSVSESNSKFCLCD